MADNVTQVKDTLKKIQKNLECPICLELLSDPYTTQCSHPFCRTCIYTVISTNKRARCPLCKEPITKRSMNENTRLGEIVEAVKELEQAIVDDTGIPSTPPRPIPAHSHEATGTPGIILHSLLHPSPVKPQCRAKRKKDAINSSPSTSSQTASYNSVRNERGSNGQVGTFPAMVEAPSSDAPGSSATGADKSESDHSKLSIKRRRKKRVKFSMEKPVIPESVKQLSSSSELKSENAVSRPLAHELNLIEEGENGARNEKCETLEKVSSSTQPGSPCDSGKEAVSAGEASPVKKRAKLDPDISPLLPTKTDTSSSLQLPTGSQHLNDDVSRILETPAPITNLMEYDVPSKEEEELTTVSEPVESESESFDVSPVIASDHNFSFPSTCVSTEPGVSIPAAPSACISETPFVQSSKLSNSNVTRVLETPFITNIQAPPQAEQSESVLREETQSDLEGKLVPCAGLHDKSNVQMETEKSEFSDSILAKESPQGDEGSYKSPEENNSHPDIDGSFSVLGQTPVINVPESPFKLEVPQCLSASVKTPPNTVAEHELEILSKHTSSSGGSTHSYQGSLVLQSGGTVCIGETQFSKYESQEKRNSVMPSPPVSPGEAEFQSPVIPLQNSTSPLYWDVGRQLPSNNRSDINNLRVRASCGHSVVPSSQPSPSYSKRMPKSPLLSGLTVWYYKQPLAEVTVGRESPLIVGKDQREAADNSQHNEAASLGLNSSTEETQDGNAMKPPSTALELSQNERGRPGTLVGSTQSRGFSVDVASITSAFSSLQCQRDNLLSQISCSVDLSSQQLGQLKLEIEAKQREIDELEAALKQVQAEEMQPDAPASTQLSVKSITTIAETLPNADVEQQKEVPEVSVSDKLSNNSLSSTTMVTVQSPAHSQTQTNEVIMTSSEYIVSQNMPANIHTLTEGVTSPHSSIQAAPEVPCGDSHSTQPTTSSVTALGSSMQHYPVKDGAGVDEIPCSTSSQSVEAVLRAADEVLRKLRNPSQAVLEERSSMEIDQDLCPTNAPSHAGIKTKLHIFECSSKVTVDDKCSRDQPQLEDNPVKATLEIDDGLYYARANKEGPVITSSGRRKRTHSSSTKSKRKKKNKASLVLLESEATLPDIPAGKATSASSPNVISGLNSSPSLLHVEKQSPVRDHCSRDARHGSTTPQCGETMLLRTPNLQSRGDIPMVSPCRPLATVGKDHPPSYVGSGLSKTQLRDVQTLARRHGGRLASCFNGSTSHVIVNADENGLCSRTVKYLQGMATGRWIISHQWVADSLEAGRLLSETDYEVVGDHVTSADTHAPMKSRQLHQNNSPGLFADYAFLFVGEFGKISQDHLAQLIQLSGGSLVSNIDHQPVQCSNREGASSFSHTCVVCEEKKIQFPGRRDILQVNSEWILDCLSNYRVLSLPIASPT